MANTVYGGHSRAQSINERVTKYVYRINWRRYWKKRTHRDIRRFTRLITNATTPQHLPTALSFDPLTTPRRPSPSFAHMQFP